MQSPGGPVSVEVRCSGASRTPPSWPCHFQLLTAVVATALLATSALAYNPTRLAPVDHRGGEPVYEVTETQLVDLLEAVNRLQRAHEGLRGDHGVMRRLRKQTRKLRRKLRRVRRMAVPVVTGPAPLDSAQFDQLRRVVKHTAFDRERLETLKASVRHANFSVSQIEQILSLFSFDRQRLNVVRIMAPKVVDRENLFRLQSQFSFSSSRRELRRIIST